MFSHLSAPQQDPILSLSVAYKADPRAEKVDLGVGVYKNDHGETPIMKAIQQAQQRQLSNQKTKSYVGLSGNETFNQCMIDMVLKGTQGHARATAVQTPGASGGLRMLGDLIHFAQPDTTVWLTNPSYVNHAPVMHAAGLKTRLFHYFDANTRQVDSKGMLDDLAQAGKNDVVLLHGCCHNPTGADLSLSDWQAITELSQKNGFTPFVDIAYQGFGDGLEKDIVGVKYMADHVDEMLLTVSCSKNFGLYRERTGAAVIVGKTMEEAQKAKGKILNLARSTYTMPPDHGADLVATVLNDETLTALWKEELIEMQQRLMSLRVALCKQLREKHNNSDFDFIESHKGMFTMLGFSADKMQRLREDYAIYGVDDGRINVAGLQEKDIPYIAQAIDAIAKAQ